MMSARLPSRIAPRASRQVVRTSRSAPRRLQSTQTRSSGSSSSSSANGTASSNFGAGVLGGVVGAALLYGIYTQTPSGKMMRTINTTVKETNKKYEQVASKLKDKTPSTDEAIDKIQQVCYSYVFWVPGGKQYVDIAFKDIEDIREANREEVDKLVSDAYEEFQQITAAGLTMEAAGKAWDALARLSQRIANLTSNASDQILENHPELEKKLGGPIDQLKQMGAEYGPEAKKVADETWKEISDIFTGGFTAENADKAHKLVEEKTEQLRKMGDAFWDKGLEKAKPYLDKNPQVRDLINNNKDILKSGKTAELFDKIKSLATEGGDSKKLEEYVKQTIEKAKETGNKDKSWPSALLGGSAGFGALGQFLGSSEKGAAQKVKDNINVLSEVLKKHSDEGQELLEETKEDLKKLLEEKAKKAQKIADAAKDSQ